MRSLSTEKRIRPSVRLVERRAEALAVLTQYGATNYGSSDLSPVATTKKDLT
jgi:hypothetical protein